MIYEIKQTLNHTLYLHRCYHCHRYHATESDRPSTCGICAGEQRDEKQNEIDSLCRTISALRGALKRKKLEAKR